MRVVSNEPMKPPITVEFTYDEAKRLARSFMNDVVWDDTHEYKLYSELYEVLTSHLSEVDAIEVESNY
jgi:hypothetical protein